MPRAPASVSKRRFKKLRGPKAEAWSDRMEGYGGPAQPSPTIGQYLDRSLAWLEVECARKTRASLPLHAIRYAALAAGSFRCRACRTRAMIKLTDVRQNTPYKWVHPNEQS
jgi:hypothetical protein